MRPPAHSGNDLPSSWGNSSGRSDLRSRLNSSNVVRHFDDKTPFLTPIGRNFDEDERKPLDGVSAPRRTISDDSIRASSGRLELKPQQFSAGRLLGQGAVQVLPLPSQISYSGRVSGIPQAGVGSQNVYGNGGLGVHRSIPNVWATRKEPVNVVESAQPAWTASSAASKLIHASALETVSSGRWHSKQSSIPYEADVEVIKHVEETGLSSRGYDESKYNKIDMVGGGGYVDVPLPRQMERNVGIGEGFHGAGRDVLDGEMAEEHPLCSDEKERNAVIYDVASQLVHAEGRNIWSEFQRPMSAEASERPKLRLVSQTKPLENPEQPHAGHKQAYYLVNFLLFLFISLSLYIYIFPWLILLLANLMFYAFQRPKSAHSVSTNAPNAESGSQTVERPKLNLKPRSRPMEQSEGIGDQDRSVICYCII